MGLARQHPVLDVRSPAEYLHAHMPGAYSFPLFTDEERKMVGTNYKQQSREQAIKIGLDYFGPKMRPMIEEAESIIAKWKENAQSSGKNSNTKVILVYCWRGGMRSSAVSWLLDLYGFKVYTLIGGYKMFRNYILDTFTLPFHFKILGGYTGSGKTEILKAMEQQGQTVVDLEDIAKHKGSAFGNIGLPPQPGQEMFENLLGIELRSKLGKNNNEGPGAGITHSPYAISQIPIWLEDESQRIGLVNLPNNLWATMRTSRIFFLDIPFEQRLQHIIEEYGGLNKVNMIDAIGRIKEKLGGLNAKMAIEYLEQENIAACFSILLKYYDKFYHKALHNRPDVQHLLQLVTCEKVCADNGVKVMEIANEAIHLNN